MSNLTNLVYAYFSNNKVGGVVEVVVDSVLDNCLCAFGRLPSLARCLFTTVGLLGQSSLAACFPPFVDTTDAALQFSGEIPEAMGNLYLVRQQQQGRWSLLAAKDMAFG